MGTARRVQLKPLILVGDFETTVYEGQTSTAVWASAVVEIGTEDVKIFNSIDETYNYLTTLNRNVIIYYHNLKFDGDFWLNYLLYVKQFSQAYMKLSETPFTVKWQDKKEMSNNSVRYSISKMGQWYTIIFKANGYYIEIRDSLKLLPYSVERIGKSFGTVHKKLDMEYEGLRYPGCEITPEEKDYIANDVLVVKEGLEIMFQEGHDKLTIGSCCLDEYKRICKHSLKNQLEYWQMFPDLYKCAIKPEDHNYQNAGQWLRKSYKGGWCYLVTGKENKIYRGGITADVNSLYPSVMHSMSGNRYPVGNPSFWTGNYIPSQAKRDNMYYFVRIKARFYIKAGYLPCIQIKGNPLYPGTKWLETSDVWNAEKGEYVTHWTDNSGKIHSTEVELTLTMTDFELIKEHYNLVNFQIIDGCYFYSQIGIFDEYIDKYAEIKKVSKGAKREQAKLFLNNLYGKMASSPDSSFKVADIGNDAIMHFTQVHEEEKKPGYIAVGSAVTSYARNFTIRAAQKNYHGVDKPGFIYADTDSIHCDLTPEEMKGITVHPTNFCCWKLESRWDKAIFVRQKTYIEHIVEADLYEHEDGWYGEILEKPEHNIKAAGMPKKCKNLLELSFEGNQDIKGYTENGRQKDWTKDELHFLFKGSTPIKRTYQDFKPGLVVPGKLYPKHLPGGIVLTPGLFTMKGV